MISPAGHWHWPCLVVLLAHSLALVVQAPHQHFRRAAARYVLEALAELDEPGFTETWETRIEGPFPRGGSGQCQWMG
jgi:hypothetical protein